MNAGPFEIDEEHKSVLRKSDLQSRGRMVFEAAAAE